MKLIMAGLHQRTAPIEIREKLAFSPDTTLQALELLRKLVYAGFIISTCNRIEIYAMVGDDIDGALLLRMFLSEWHHIDISAFADYLSYRSEQDVIHHLFALASGIDSIVLGEDQILNQMKKAHSVAKHAHSLNKILNRLMIKALEVGKRVRSQTQIAKHQLSTVSLALSKAKQMDGAFDGKSVVILGAGRIAELALKHLKGTQVRSLTIINRTYERALELAETYQNAGIDQIIARPISELAHALQSCDMFISCIFIPEPLFSAHNPLATNFTRYCTIVDLSMPRSIDTSLFPPETHTYISLDHIQSIADANRAARSAEIEDVLQIISQEVGEFLEWLNIQQVVPTISALKQRAEHIRMEELQKTLRRLGPLDEHQQQLVQAMSMSIVNTLLHEPIASLRNAPNDVALAQAVNQLFQLSEQRENHVEHV